MPASLELFLHRIADRVTYVLFLVQQRSPAPLRMTGPVWSGVRRAVWGLPGIMRWHLPPCAQKPALLWLRKKCPLPTQRSLGPSEMPPRQQQGLWLQGLMLRDQSTIQHRTPPALWCPDPTQWQVQSKAFIFIFCSLLSHSYCLSYVQCHIDDLWSGAACVFCVFVQLLITFIACFHRCFTCFHGNLWSPVNTSGLHHSGAPNWNLMLERVQSDLEQEERCERRALLKF